MKWSLMWEALQADRISVAWSIKGTHFCYITGITVYIISLHIVEIVNTYMYVLSIIQNIVFVVFHAFTLRCLLSLHIAGL